MCFAGMTAVNAKAATVSVVSPQRQWLTILALFVAAALPLLTTDVLPLIDFYNHMARYFVLANIDHVPVLAENYQANWIILPNIGLDVLVTAALAFVPQTMADNLTILFVFAVQYGGILYFNRAATGRTSALVALLALPLLYSFILNWGFANFLLGIGMLFWGAGWWLQQRLRQPNRLVVALPVACIIAVLIFFIHGVAFAIYGLLLGAIEIGLFWQKRPRRLLDLLAAMVPLAVQAIVPVMLFLSSRISGASGGISNAEDSARRLAHDGQLADRVWELLLYRLTTIVRVAEGPTLMFDIISMALMLGLILLLVRWRRLRLVSFIWPGLLLAALLIVAVPPAMFGIGYISDRMPLFAAFLLVAGLRPQLTGDARERRVIAAMAALVALRLLVIGVTWHGYAADNRDFATVASALPPGQLVETLAVGGGRLDTQHRRCQMYGPMLVSNHGAVSRLFAGAASQPIIVRGPLLAAIASTPRPKLSQMKVDPAAFDTAIANVSKSKFPWLFLCDAGRLTRPLPPGLEMVAARGRFSLLRVNNADALAAAGGTGPG